MTDGLLRVDLRGDPAGCGPDCLAWVESWQAWLAKNGRRPLAIADCSPGYRSRLGRNGRGMLNKSDRLYRFEGIDRNDHLEAMFAINTSVPARQGRPMTAAYREPLEPSVPARLCAFHGDEWHGGFTLDGRLVVYARLEMFGDFGILNTLLSDRSAGGAMNGMIAHLAGLERVRWLNYLRLPSSSGTLTEFKKRVGFRDVRVLES